MVARWARLLSHLTVRGALRKLVSEETSSQSCGHE